MGSGRLPASLGKPESIATRSRHAVPRRRGVPEVTLRSPCGGGALMRKTTVTAVTSVALLALATGCTGTGTTSSGEGDGENTGDNKIRWLVEDPEDAAATKALEKHVATFSEESGVEVEVATVPFESFGNIVQTQLRSGEGPDVLNWGSGPDFGGRLAEAGLLMDLTEAYEERDWQVYDFAKERVTTPDGMVYGIPGRSEEHTSELQS